uniref:NADH dehydrogenase subunit 2 n=1 Tax=Entransia fimbriata TaxID=130991 RepID=U5YGS9_9VIRI|nr:NADH dehydrogenase subunit 2 [Entransia fimbriata]AGZ90291.1 NADH dehydrogenase subunit 2 [Entransia fimbriata]
MVLQGGAITKKDKVIMFQFQNDLLAIFPEIFLFNATIILLLYGAFTTTNVQYNNPPTINIGWLAIGVLSMTITLVLYNPLLCIGGFEFFVTKSGAFFTAFNGSLINDFFTTIFKLFALISTACVLGISANKAPLGNSGFFEYIVLILFSACSMLFMISTNDLIVMYLVIEFQSLCAYVLAASKRNSEFSTEAGLKYFVLGAFSSGILLLGCSFMYGITGATNFEDLARIITPSFSYSFSPGSSQLIGVVLLLLAVAFLFKITAVPFHMWSPDVYEGSPTAITAFFMVAPKIALLALQLRLFVYCFYDTTWQNIFFICSIASMLGATLAAMAQTKVKRFLAYSSIAHVGYLLIGFSCATIEGVQSLLIALVIYVIMTLNFFAILLSISARKRFTYISDLEGYGAIAPILAVTLSINMFSLAGIPPLAGFFSKFYLFFAALGCGAYLLALVGIITSVISCFYYIRFIKTIYFTYPQRGCDAHLVINQTSQAMLHNEVLEQGFSDKMGQPNGFAVSELSIVLDPTINKKFHLCAGEKISRPQSYVLALTFLFLLFFWVYPSPLFLITHKAALCICL